ncbi:hypothetical protein AURDEDRAFT_129904 [Auricularia subglabra TFB-10046 SS5]|uniref:Uncharacterized protein n=1 Tax=Auricularia subglabra (strain TFB-10046 / SS5) TaxID=717982 RepID=J0D9X8_AURST|nr:hypothetical protein AURDEDRAFT_129904 [Auricularia subglabra TFB-10046 SS5]
MSPSELDTKQDLEDAPGGEQPYDEDKGDHSAQEGPAEAQNLVWTWHDKFAIVALASAAGTLSMMSTRIYYPAIPTLANAFGVSIGVINLTVTSYLVMQGLYGWSYRRGIFWFMFAFSAAVIVALISVLRETLRAVVGNGSIEPPLYLQPLVPVLTRYGKGAVASPPLGKKPASEVFRALVPRFLKEPEMLAILVSNAGVFALFHALSTSISPILMEGYPFLTQTTVKFARFGGTRGARVAPGFPLERARLHLVPVYISFVAGSIVVFGWTAGRTGLAAPLVFNFITGLSITTLMNVHQTIRLDLAPGQGASVTAVGPKLRTERLLRYEMSRQQVQP